jgi:hypothetical protein
MTLFYQLSKYCNRCIPLSLLFVFSLLSVRAVFTQESHLKPNFTPPRIILEVSGSFELPVQDTYGHLKDFFTFKNYGLVHGVGFHFNAKYGVNKKATLYPFISLGFAQLQNNDFGIAYIDSNNLTSGYPLPGSLSYHSTPGSSILILRNLYAGIGLQYYFISNKPIMPYAGIEVDYNYLWGYYTQTPNSAAGPNSSIQQTFNIKPATRLGIGAEVGFDYRISKNLGFLFGTRYKFANLFGKKSEYTEPVTVDPGAANNMNLLDKSAPELNANLNKSRNITYLEFYLGFTLFLGKINTQ